MQPQHCALAGAALLATLAQGLGAAYSPALRDPWIQVYGLIARTMRDAAAADSLDAALMINDAAANTQCAPAGKVHAQDG